MPPFKDQGCDNMLRDKRQMTDECGLMVDGRIEETRNRKLPACHFIRASLTWTHQNWTRGSEVRRQRVATWATSWALSIIKANEGNFLLNPCTTGQLSHAVERRVHLLAGKCHKSRRCLNFNETVYLEAKQRFAAGGTVTYSSQKQSLHW
jgi:hypothetical protein